MFDPTPAPLSAVYSPQRVTPEEQRLQSPTQPVSAAGGAAAAPAILPQVVQVQVAGDMLDLANKEPGQVIGALLDVTA